MEFITFSMTFLAGSAVEFWTSDPNNQSFRFAVILHNENGIYKRD